MEVTSAWKSGKQLAQGRTPLKVKVWPDHLLMHTMINLAGESNERNRGFATVLEARAGYPPLTLKPNFGVEEKLKRL